VIELNYRIAIDFEGFTFAISITIEISNKDKYNINIIRVIKFDFQQ